jgi:riboflavin kinase/FMN adenylyltransferase
MQRLHSFDEIAHPLPSVASVGTFDGVHLGHQQLIRAVVNDAQARGVQSAIITFFPHPRVVLGRAPAKYLTLPEEKAAQIEALGVDVLIVLDFTLATAQTPAAQFVDWMVEKLRLQHLWIGPDFALGYKRQGDAAYLSGQGQQRGFGVTVSPELSVGPAAISSTRIRDALARGDVRDANLCLGRPFRVRGRYDGDRGLCVDERQWLPAPATYPVLIEGRVNEATLSLDAPCAVTLAQPLHDGDGLREVVAEFV